MKWGQFGTDYYVQIIFVLLLFFYFFPWCSKTFWAMKGLLFESLDQSGESYHHVDHPRVAWSSSRASLYLSSVVRLASLAFVCYIVEMNFWSLSAIVAQDPYLIVSKSLALGNTFPNRSIMHSHQMFSSLFPELRGSIWLLFSKIVLQNTFSVFKKKNSFENLNTSFWWFWCFLKDELFFLSPRNSSKTSFENCGPNIN